METRNWQKSPNKIDVDAHTLDDMLLDHMYMHVLLDEMWGSNDMWGSMEMLLLDTIT